MLLSVVGANKQKSFELPIHSPIITESVVEDTGVIGH